MNIISNNNEHKTIVLINPNFLKPPISPVGLEYIAEVLRQDGFGIIWIDLCFAKNWEEVLREQLIVSKPDFIGITVRNFDEAMMASQTFFIDLIRNVAHICKQTINAPIILGGAGFNIAPCEILQYTHADYGLIGNGVNSIAEFITSIGNQNYNKFPGCVYQDKDGNTQINPIAKSSTNKYSSQLFHRNFADLERYFREGGQIGIETKRGCLQECIYCVESRQRYIAVETRSPESVVYEIEQLVNRGINVFHWCDSEFNIPLEHAIRICDEIVNRGVHKEIKWYAYCVPVPFTEVLALKMEQAGCAGINFGVDSLCDKVLSSLGKSHRFEDIKQLMKILRKTNIAVMFDLLLGSPKETQETAMFTVEQALKMKPDAIGISLGVRIYPHTELQRKILSLWEKGSIVKTCIHGKSIEENKDFLFPIFYLSEQLDDNFFNYLKNLVKHEPSVFLSLPAEEEGSYSYCNHDYLTKAIQNGARGAYWDILRKRNV